MMSFTRLPAMGAITLAFTLGACDKAPLSNSDEIPAEPQMQLTSVQGTFGNLIAALNNITVQIDRLSALNDLTIGDVTVVNVQDLLNNSLNGNNVEILNNALNNNNVQVLQDFLNNSLNNNDVDIQILEDAVILSGFVIGDVIAVNVLSGGDVIVFAM